VDTTFRGRVPWKSISPSASTPPQAGASALSSVAASASLFEIDQELDLLIEEIQEEIDTKGEPSPERIELFQEFLKAHGEKVDRIGRFVRSMEARTSHCRSEAQRLSERARTSENKVTRTKTMVLYFLKSRDLKKVEGAEFTLRRQANSQDSVIISDQEQLPLDYQTIGLTLNGRTWKTLLDLVPEDLRRTLKVSVRETSPDNDAIRLAAARKEEVSGAQVKRGEHVRVI